jgi:hypothetical protein
MYCSQKSIAYRPLVKASLRAYFTFTLKEAFYDLSTLAVGHDACNGSSTRLSTL